MSRIAVVIPAHNEHALLPACLESLAVAAVPDIEVEIIVVADDCTDGTAAVAAAAGAIVLTTTARNVGQARATGMRHALRHGTDGLWLATTDADSVVPPYWLRWHLEHAHAGTDLLAGTVVVEDWSARPDGLARHYELEYQSTSAHTHGANLGVAAHVYRSAGGFPASPQNEDQALLHRVRRIGGQVVTDARFPVTTSARRSGRAPNGFAAYLNALETTLPSDQTARLWRQC